MTMLQPTINLLKFIDFIFITMLYLDSYEIEL